MASTAHAGRGLLVVEDDPDIREALRLVLETEGYPVTTAGDGAEAMRQLQAATPPCLILLDLMMPVMDGWQFRDAQQRDPALAAIPVVVISADGRVPQKAASIGAAGYLKKPVDFDTLVDVVRRYC
jgi:CheY-like chemotaxis protein